MDISHVPSVVWLVVALIALRVVGRPVIALLFGGAIGKAVAAKQPDNIHLVPADASAARNAGPLDEQARALVAEGFRDAGWFKVTEMPDVVIRLLAHEPEGWLASLYEHRLAGQWAELALRFPDGTRMSFTTMRATGLKSLPGFESMNMPGVTLATLLRAARNGRGKKDLTPLSCSASSAPGIFEAGYAEITALRKGQGISRSEVVAVSLRPPVAKDKKAA